VQARERKSFFFIRFNLPVPGLAKKWEKRVPSFSKQKVASFFCPTIAAQNVVTYMRIWIFKFQNRNKFFKTVKKFIFLQLSVRMD
jgi:hypothetical protein